MLATSFVDSANPYFFLGASAVALWGFIWGGIRLWHRRAAKTLAEKFKPMIDSFRDEIGKRLDSQDRVLQTVEHEVTFNNGSSLKDGVKALGSQLAEVVGVLTTPPPTALVPFPALGVIDTQLEHGRILSKMATDVADLKKRKQIA